VIDPELNIVVKISEGSATRLQHIKTVIKPSSIKKTIKISGRLMSYA
jgi:hypothetical protein